MIIQKTGNTLEMSEDFKSKEFGIKNVNKVFKMLVDGIYSDKIGSIVREIVSNAIDANTEAGSITDVEVTVLNRDSLTGQDYTFIVRDYGKGISPERMYDIFINLGESTKDLSNNEIGGFGLGSKSPFAYTDTFNVKTIHEGIEYMYSMVINENNIPNVLLIYKTETDKISGTEVIIPILNSSDYIKFKEKIKSQLRYFDNIKYNFDFDKHPFIYEGKRIIILDSKEVGYNYGYTQNILLHKIPYTIDCDSNKLKTVHKNVLVKFEIGEIKPVISREDIEYNPSNLEVIRQVFEEANAELDDYIKNKLSTIENIRERYKVFKTFSGDNSTFEGVPKKDFKFITVEEYKKPYWRKRIQVSLYHKLNDILDGNSKLYYVDKGNHSQETLRKLCERYGDFCVVRADKNTDIGQFIINNLTNVEDVFDISKSASYSNPYPAKEFITFTEIDNYTVNVRNLTYENFINDYCKDKLVLYALNTGEYKQHGTRIGYVHIKLESRFIKKIKDHVKLYHVNQMSEMYLELLKTHDEFSSMFLATFLGEKYTDEKLAYLIPYSKSNDYLKNKFSSPLNNHHTTAYNICIQLLKDKKVRFDEIKAFNNFLILRKRLNYYIYNNRLDDKKNKIIDNYKNRLK